MSPLSAHVPLISPRATRSIVTSGGLGHLKADTPEAFVRVAASLASDPRALRDQRRGMRERLRSTAMLDHAGFTRRLESAYRRMWETWVTNVPNVGFEV
jgi:predicted O-linked N-acetylglucosamine transferase (SPINDLY family)